MIVRKIEKDVRTFEMNRAIGLVTDFSKTGIPNFLFQKHSGCSDESREWSLQDYSDRFPFHQ